MATFDEQTNPQAFSQILQPQAATQQAPQMPAGADDNGGGMAAVLHPQNVFEHGKQWASENPLGAQMLLHTFMRMAQGGGASLVDSIGQGVATGAQAGLLNLAQQKQDAQDQQKIQLDQQNKAADQSIRSRQVGVSEGDLALKKSNAPVEQGYKKALTGKLESETQIAKDQAPLHIAALNAKLLQLDDMIKTSTDARKTAELQRQKTAMEITRDGFKLDLEKRYAGQEREAKIQGQQLDNQGKAITNTVNDEYLPQERGAKVTGMQLDNQGKVLSNEAGQQALDDSQTMTPEQRLAYSKRGTPVKTDEEQFNTFLTRNIDAFDGDAKRARAAWDASRPDAAAKEQQAAAEEKAGIETALKGAKIGAIVQAPNGKYYRRLK